MDYQTGIRGRRRLVGVQGGQFRRRRNFHELQLRDWIELVVALGDRRDRNISVLVEMFRRLFPFTTKLMAEKCEQPIP
jgi:hypothetical protein